MGGSVGMVTIGFGDYKSIAYKGNKKTEYEVSWTPPEGLEAKHSDEFDKFVREGLANLEKQLSSGVAKATEWLANADKRIMAVVDLAKAKKAAPPAELKFYSDFVDQLPKFVENLEEQRKLIINTMLDKIFDNAILKLANKIKRDVKKKKVIRILKITGYVTLFVLATVAAVVAAVATWGVAAGPIIGVVGGGLAAIGGFGGLVGKARGIMNDSKDDPKGMAANAESFAKASTEFHAMLDRQTSLLTLKKNELGLMEKKIDETNEAIIQLNKLKGSFPDGTIGKKVADAMTARAEMRKAFDALQDKIKTQSDLLATASKNLDPKAAKDYAATLKGGWETFDKVCDLMNQIGGILGSVGNAIPGK